jgi:DNA polymerase-3 subunit beta
MDIVVRKGDLLKELQLVQGIVERKNSIPILSNVLVEARSGRLNIAATDLDVSLRCGCTAEVAAPGAITLAAKKLFEITRSLPDSDVHIKVQADSWTQIDCERVSFKMAGLPREDFPSLPEARGAQGVELPGDALKELIARTAFAITAEDARYYLAGALMILEKGAMSMVATDGHRLSYASCKVALPVSEAQRVLVPRKAIQELSRLLETEAAASFQQIENHLVFTVGDRTLASKTIEGQFPAFEKVIATAGDKTVTVGRETLATAIRRVSLLSTERSRAIKLALSGGRVDLAASSPDLGEARESISVDYAGGAVDIGFNAQYLLDFLAAAGTEEVLLELKDHESQGVLKPVPAKKDASAIDYRYVVMPMRL